LHIKPLSTSKSCLFIAVLVLCRFAALGQSTLSTGNPAAPTAIYNAPQRDTNINKSNTNKWNQQDANVSYQKLGSARTFYPDTSIHTFHRRPFIQPWKRDLGNLGSPINNLFFTPEYRVGPTLGYHVYDPYRFNVDSLGFYNTNRPYSVFTYQLGSKLEQVAGIFNTQNIRPNWNFAVDYRKTNSPGYYKIQRNNNDNANFTTNYKSLNKRYELYVAMVYNKEQHDENGGIVNEMDLDDPRFGDRRTINALYQSNYSNTRSSMFNSLRDFTGMVLHTYTWGKTDTTYNKDSTQYSYKLLPRFSITHKMEISTEKHTFKDLTPDSLNYTPYFNHSFLGGGYYAVGTDSVFSEQKWFWVDNRIVLNGYLGRNRQLKFSAGIGNRFDKFTTEPVPNLIPDSLPNLVYVLGKQQSSYVDNYIVGEVKKEALTPGQWECTANTQFYFTGHYAGDLTLNASVGKGLKVLEAVFTGGLSQQIGNAPYAYTIYGNAYTKLFWNFNKENVTQVYATVGSPALKLSGGVRNYIIGNYIFINQQLQPAQYAPTFNLAQAWARKIFKLGSFYLDNELVLQQPVSGAPVNVPQLMGRNQLSYEHDLFHSAIRIATGVEVRYNNPYKPSGYSSLLNRFYYQDALSIYNKPELSLFLNFRIKRFRAYIMGDQLQQLFSNTNTIIYTGTPGYFAGASVLPVYGAQDAMLRFGFTWALVN
jgi:hypothetical protein